MGLDLLEIFWYNTGTVKKKGDLKMYYCDKINCGYYYQDEEDDFPCCHYNDPWPPAPCEYDDVEEEY